MLEPLLKPIRHKKRHLSFLFKLFMTSTTVSKEKLGINILDLLVETKLVISKSEAKRLVEQNGISINQATENDVNRIIDESDLKERFIVVQKGKKYS
jgi:tyrosyl-tRNA synthetase